MTDKKPTNSRRKALKTVVVGSGAIVAGKSLPEGWTKPVVNAVMLPSHAATTPGAGDGDGTDTYPGCIYDGVFCDGEDYVIVDNIGSVVIKNREWKVEIQETTLGPDGVFSKAAVRDVGEDILVVSGVIPCGRTSVIAVKEDDNDPDDYTLDGCV